MTSDIYGNTDIQRVIIEDAIILVANMAAKDSNELMYRYSENSGALVVSFRPFQWSLAVDVVIEDKEQIARMENAIRHNIDVLQSALPDYHRANSALTAALFHGCDAVKQAYRVRFNGEGSSYLSYDEFKAQYLAPLQNDFYAANGRLYQGDITLHPNQYLQSLGVKHLRLESVSPSYR